MTFSDGNTTIRHAENSCRNHRERAGKNLCVHCGNWFCDECMSVTHKYLCVSCAGAAMEAAEKADIERERRRPLARFSLPLLFGGFLLLTALLRRAGIGLIALPFVFFIAVNQLTAHRRRNVRPNDHPRKRAGFFSSSLFSKNREEITNEQLSTVLRLGGGQVTAEKLARLAGVGRETAKKFLDKEVVEGRMNVEAGDTELVYKRF